MLFRELFAVGAIAASAAMASPTSLKAKRGSGAHPSEVVVYWGQSDGVSQMDLSTLCSDPTVDIVNLAFVNVFPEQGFNGIAQDNFASSCDGTYIVMPDGTQTELLAHCPGIAPGIDTCRANGKKILLSLGGGYPNNQHFSSKKSATDFAEFLWYSFGPDTTKTNIYPRPFGNSYVDGFDLDIESTYAATGATDAAGLQQYFPDFVAELRTLYAARPSETYYISAAPQCIVDDVHFSTYITSSWFDFIFVQLYNTPECSARTAITPGGSNTFGGWLTQDYTGNPNVKIYAGLPANKTNAANSDQEYYLEPSEVKEFVSLFLGSEYSKFAGIMLWEATFNSVNTICGKEYSYWCKKAMSDAVAGNLDAYPSTCPTSSSSSVTPSSPSIPSSSSHGIPSFSVPTHSYSHSSLSHKHPSSSHGGPSISHGHSSFSHSPHTTFSLPLPTSHSFSTHAPYTNGTFSRSGGHGPRPTTSTGSGSGSSGHGHGHGHGHGSGSGSGSGHHHTKGAGHGSGSGSGSDSTSHGHGHGHGSPPAVTKSAGSGGSSGKGGNGGSGESKTTITKTVTSTYVDVCPTGWTTKTVTQTITEIEGATATGTWTDPWSWTTAVTICTACGEQPTTVTVTIPITSTLTETHTWGATDGASVSWDAETSETWAVETGSATATSTVVVVVTPVPASQYWATHTSSTTLADAASVTGSWTGESSGVAGGAWGASTTTSTASGTWESAPAEFTGAANKMNVGAGVIGGLAFAFLAM